MLSAGEKGRALAPKIGRSKVFSLVVIGRLTLQRLSMSVPWKNPKANRSRGRKPQEVVDIGFYKEVRESYNYISLGNQQVSGHLNAVKTSGAPE